jgi:hypothetical protein
MTHANPELDVSPWPEDGQAGQFPAYSPGHDPYASGDSVRRPGSVTAAAVLAFIYGGLCSLGYIIMLAAVVATAARWTTPVLVVAGTLLLAGLYLGVMTVRGAVSAVRGRGRELLERASWINLTLSVLGLVSCLIDSDIPTAVGTIVQIAPLIAILALIKRPSSIEFFRARRKGAR